jgi:hypothetical protein
LPFTFFTLPPFHTSCAFSTAHLEGPEWQRSKEHTISKASVEEKETIHCLKQLWWWGRQMGQFRPLLSRAQQEWK